MAFEVLITKSRYVPQPLRDQILLAVESIAKDFDWQAAQVSVAVVNDRTIQDVNRQYLNHDYPTDVISFNLSDDENILEGEVIVSWQTAKRVAQENGWTTSQEMLLYIIHGMLHIVGLDDATPAQSKRMRQKERHYMQAIAGDTQNCS
ncbi:MAG: rRNA maturation RNase YbeY [Planctomycetota bacterium]|jgi:probable rRNA maturation factor